MLVVLADVEFPGVSGLISDVGNDYVVANDVVVACAVAVEGEDDEEGDGEHDKGSHKKHPQYTTAPQTQNIRK